MAAESDGVGGLSVGIAAALGGMGAVLIDLVQKGDASAIFKLTGTVNRYGHVFLESWPDIPVIGVGAALIVFAIGLAFMSQASSRSAAFYSGASVLSVLMTLVPYDSAMPPPSGTVVNKVSLNENHREFGGARLIPAVYVPTARASLIEAAASQLPVTVVVHIPLKEGQKNTAPQRVDGRLYDAVSGRQWQLSYADPSPDAQASAKEVTYRFDFAIEMGEARQGAVADLRLRVWAPGFGSGHSALKVTNAAPVMIEVTLQPSGLPQGVEGLGRIFDRPSF